MARPIGESLKGWVSVCLLCNTFNDFARPNSCGGCAGQIEWRRSLGLKKYLFKNMRNKLYWIIFSLGVLALPGCMADNYPDKPVEVPPVVEPAPVVPTPEPEVPATELPTPPAVDPVPPVEPTPPVTDPVPADPSSVSPAPVDNAPSNDPEPVQPTPPTPAADPTPPSSNPASENSEAPVNPPSEESAPANP